LIAPGSDFGWLAEIETDIALVMIPRPGEELRRWFPQDPRRFPSILE